METPKTDVQTMALTHYDSEFKMNSIGSPDIFMNQI